MDKCKRCGNAPSEKPHPCPYESEIGDDDETLCNCCEDCEGECTDEIILLGVRSHRRVPTRPAVYAMPVV